MSLCFSNEPIYHTLDDESGAETSVGPRSAPTSGGSRFRSAKGNPDDDLVYINSALEVVYPTSTMLRKQQRLLEQMGQQRNAGWHQKYDELLGAEENLRLNLSDPYENEGGYYHDESYVPSPAPGSFPRNFDTANHQLTDYDMPINSPNSQLMSQIANRLNSHSASK